MTTQGGNGAGQSRSERTDYVLRAVVVLLVAAVLGLLGLFGYTVWQARNAEENATPAQRALGGMRDFVRANPNSAAGRVRYGEALAAAGLLTDAVEQLKAAVKLDEKHTGAWLDLGLIAMQTDDRASAAGYFEKVVELTAGSQYEAINQRREKALFHLGEIYLDKRAYEDAVGYFKAALRIRRDASDTYYLLAQALHGMDSDETALENLEAATALDPNYAEAHNLWGEILLDRGDVVNAAVHLRKALELAPDRKEAKASFAKLGSADDAMKRSQEALARGDKDEAVEQALLAREIEPDNADAVVAHVRVLLAMGEKKLAAKYVKEALKLDPDNAEAKEIAADLGK